VNYIINCSSPVHGAGRNEVCVFCRKFSQFRLLSFQSLVILLGISRQKAFFRVNQKFFNKLIDIHSLRRSISSLQCNTPNCILMPSLNATLPSKKWVKFC